MAPSVKKFLIVIALGSLLAASYGARAHKGVLNASTLHDLARADTFTFDLRSKLTGCILNGVYPDHACTPGAIFPNATKDDICRPGYSRSVRNVSSAKKEAIYAEYGITTHEKGEYEIDHFISLELGGSNESANLFPEPAEPRPGFHEKDEIENYLHAQVCGGNISLLEGQILVSAHWLEVYNLLH